MAAASVEMTWTMVETGMAEILDRATAILEKQGLSLIYSDDEMLLGRQGSAIKTWLCMAVFAPARVIPKRVKLELSDGAGQVHVKAHVEDEFIPLSIAPRRFQNSFTVWLQELKDQLIGTCPSSPGSESTGTPDFTSIEVHRDPNKSRSTQDLRQRLLALAANRITPDGGLSELPSDSKVLKQAAESATQSLPVQEEAEFDGSEPESGQLVHFETEASLISRALVAEINTVNGKTPVLNRLHIGIQSKTGQDLRDKLRALGVNTAAQEAPTMGTADEGGPEQRGPALSEGPSSNIEFSVQPKVRSIDTDLRPGRERIPDQDRNSKNTDGHKHGWFSQTITPDTRKTKESKPGISKRFFSRRFGGRLQSLSAGGVVDEAIDDSRMALPEKISQEVLLGNQLFEEGSWVGAIRRYDSAILGLGSEQRDERSLLKPISEIYCKRGLAYLKYSQSKLEDSPTNEDTPSTHYMAISLVLQAIEDYSESIRLDDTEGDAYNSRGLAYLQLGQYERAIKSFRNASEHSDNALSDFTCVIRIHPGFADAYANRAIAHSYLKRISEMEADIDNAVLLGFNRSELETKLNSMPVPNKPG